MSATGDSTNSINIGLWGASGSGKTSYIAALNLAATQRLGWRIYGQDDRSSEWLIKHTHEMEDEKLFPLPTDALPDLLRFRLSGPPQLDNRFARAMVSRVGQALGRTFSAAESMSFELTVADFPGEWFSPQGPDTENLKEMISRFGACDGMVFLFNPVPLNYNNYQRFYPLIQRLCTQLQVRGRLPHNLSICVTKFDQPQLIEWAKGQELIQTHEHESGFFLPKSNQTFFESIARHQPRFMEQLGIYFESDRVQYFATSSIGFRTVHGRMNQSNYVNFVDGVMDKDGNSRARIIGDPTPINVLEPLIALATAIQRRKSTALRGV